MHRPLVAVLPLVIAFNAASVAQAARPFESHDAVEMADFIAGPVFSPDFRYFVTATQRGLLPQGVTEATVWLFDVSAVRRALADGLPISPLRLAQVSGAISTGSGALGHGSLLTRLQWEAGSAAVLFLGRDGNENRRLFRVRLDDRQSVSLSLPAQDVVDYAIAGKRLVYFAGPDASSGGMWNSVSPASPDIVAGAGETLLQLLYPNLDKINRVMPTQFGVWSVEGTTVAPIEDARAEKPMQILGSYNVSLIEPSPDGTRVVALTHSHDVPKIWERYEVAQKPDSRPFRSHRATDDPKSDYGWALQYQMIDLEKGEARPLLDSPIADYQRGSNVPLQAVWSPDSRHVTVSASYLPLNPHTGSGPLRACVSAMVDSHTGSVRCLDGRNGLNATPVGHQPPLDLSVRQSLDEPPALFARELESGQERMIFDPNPQLADIALGTVTEIFWSDSQGRSINGGLVKPADFVPGKRYPLVIQTHNFRSRRFYRVGISDTASAGRALAGRGMLVLQVDEPDSGFMFTPQEGTENGTNVYLAAIDKLAIEGLIDPQKVGITGYSRTAFYVSKAITDAPDRFAAAVVANGDPGSLMGYYGAIAQSTEEKEWTGLFAGALPYGEGLKQWIDHAPGFRTDRIRAPVLVVAADPAHLIPLWGLYAPLRQQGKPVELQYIRGGQHNLIKPLEQLAHQEMIVDWFDYWLANHKDAKSVKADQYRRWASLAPYATSFTSGL